MFRGARRDIAKTSARALQPHAGQPQVCAALRAAADLDEDHIIRREARYALRLADLAQPADDVRPERPVRAGEPAAGAASPTGLRRYEGRMLSLGTQPGSPGRWSGPPSSDATGCR
jgi:hypothetical protein